MSARTSPCGEVSARKRVLERASTTTPGVPGVGRGTTDREQPLALAAAGVDDHLEAATYDALRDR